MLKIVKIVAKGFVRLKSCKSSPIVRQFLQRATLYTCIEGMTWKGSLATSFQKLGIVFCNPKTSSPITRYRELLLHVERERSKEF